MQSYRCIYVAISERQRQIGVSASLRGPQCLAAMPADLPVVPKQKPKRDTDAPASKKQAKTAENQAAGQRPALRRQRSGGGGEEIIPQGEEGAEEQGSASGQAAQMEGDEVDKAKAKGGRSVKFGNKMDPVAMGWMMSLLVKSTLQLQQNFRELAAAVYHTILIPTESTMAVKMVEAGRRYALAVRTDGKGHTWDSPHTHAHKAMILGLLDSAAKIGELTSKVLSEHTEEIKDMEPYEIGDISLACRVKTTANKEEMRIFFAMAEGHKGLTRSIKEGARQLGGRIAEGRAPRSYMERELAKLLEEA